MAPRTSTDLLTAAEHVTARRDVVAVGLTAPQPAWERSSSDIGMMKVYTHDDLCCKRTNEFQKHDSGEIDGTCAITQPCDSTPVTLQGAAAVVQASK
jgi:hypothetical protein